MAGGSYDKIAKLVGVDQAEIPILLLEEKVIVLHIVYNREINESGGIKSRAMGNGNRPTVKQQMIEPGFSHPRKLFPVDRNSYKEKWLSTCMMKRTYIKWTESLFSVLYQLYQWKWLKMQTPSSQLSQLSRPEWKFIQSQSWKLSKDFNGPFRWNSCICTLM